jgi:hypothetical protein
MNLLADNGYEVLDNPKDSRFPIFTFGDIEPDTLESTMKKTVNHHRKQSGLLVLILGLTLLGPFPVPAAAGMLQKTGVTLKKDFGPQIMLNQTLFNVNIPLAISNMPGPWKNAKIKALAIVYFLDGAGKTIGYGLGEGVEELIPLDVVLDNGGYNGTAVFPIRASMGTMSDKTCCVTIVVAEQSSQHMVIGVSKGGTAPNSGDCGGVDFSHLTPGMILPY